MSVRWFRTKRPLRLQRRWTWTMAPHPTQLLNQRRTKEIPEGSFTCWGLEAEGPREEARRQLVQRRHRERSAFRRVRESCAAGIRVISQSGAAVFQQYDRMVYRLRCLVHVVRVYLHASSVRRPLFSPWFQRLCLSKLLVRCEGSSMHTKEAGDQVGAPMLSARVDLFLPFPAFFTAPALRDAHIALREGCVSAAEDESLLNPANCDIPLAARLLWAGCWMLYFTTISSPTGGGRSNNA